MNKVFLLTKKKTNCDIAQKLRPYVGNVLLDFYPISCYNIYRKGKEVNPMSEFKCMTKKQRKEYFKRFRNTWDINPVSRRENKNKWKEKKRNEKEKHDRETF